MRDFTKGGIGRSIFSFSIPLMLGNLFLQFYNLVNSVFVGHFLGDDALAAVGTVYPIVFFLISLIIGIGSGASVVVSHFFGAKHFEKIPLIISTFYIFFIILGLSICLFSICFAEQIFDLLQLKEEIANLAVPYMQIYMIGMFFSFCFNSAVSILRGLGDSKTQLYYLIAANILNGFLSYIFLAVMKWDLNSTAWATVISQAAAFFTLFIHLQRTNPYIKIKKADRYFDKEILKEIIKIGFPTGVQQSVIALSQIFIIGIVAMFGSDALTAYSAASRVESIALLLILNLSSALSSFVGQNYGAKLLTRVKQSLKSSLKITCIISFFTMLIFCFFGKQIMSWFSQTPEVVNIGYEYLIIMGIFWLILGAMNIFQSFFRGLGDTFIPMLISILSLWAIRLPLSYLLSFELGTTGIWIGAPVAWLIGLIAYLIYYYKAKHMKVFKTLSLIFLICLSPSLKAQDCSDFLPPLKIALSSSGHFGELRSNHFHSGIDLRTNATTGHAVICPFDGEVSRIKVQVYGGGKNLYIDHTNGYTTVYMHLENYYGKIANYVKKHQYKIQSYAFDLYVPKGTLKLKKGDTIAFSGNTGSSGGPHLHYEIRNTSSQKTLNPVLQGLKLQDNISPTLYSLRIVPNDDFSTINGKNEALFSDVRTTKTSILNDTINVNGSFYLCFEAYDRSQGSTAKNGVYDNKVYVDDKLIFRYNNKGFYFADSRYINSIIDYAYYKTKGKRMLRTKQLPNGKFPNVSYEDKGIIKINNGEIKKIKIILEDEKKNKNTYSFYLKGENNPAPITIKKENTKGIKHLYYSKATNFPTNDLSQISFPANALYEDIDIVYSYSQGKYSCVHKIGDNTIPLHKKFTMKLRYNKELTPYKDKAIIVRLNNKGGKTSIGGKLDGDYITASTYDLGTYTIEIDTIAPKITAKNFKNNQKLNPKQKFLKIKITDNLAGIKNVNAYLNDKWHLMEYDGKSATIFCPTSDFPKGKSILKIVVVDEKNNKATKTFNIIK